MRDDGLWTINELSAAVAEALAAGYPGQTNGRVREVPDRRTIRWYTTIGLLDRPAAMRGRTALYGRRHLLQIVAIKRLQADGHSLAEVQQRLVGATGTMLEDIARLPEDEPSPAAGSVPASEEPTPAAAKSVSARAEWQAAAAEPRPGKAGPTPEVAESAGGRAKFWAAARVAPAASTAPTAPVAPAAATASAAPTAPVAPAAPTAAGPVVVPGIRLGTGVTLLLGAATHVPDTEELAAIEAAAGPLLDTLRRLGLDLNR